MSVKKRRMALLLLAMALLSGCAAAPPDRLIRSDPANQPLVSADAGALAADSFEAVLYFRYEDTGYLAAEERRLSVTRNETKEKALVQALLQGPSATSSALSPLFPPGTEVLAASLRDHTLFITFNEALLGRYGDEPGDISAQPWKTEAPLRRRLCMDALAATLTEAGLCTQVQVLVFRENVQATSLRLHAGFFDRSADPTLLSAFTRNEDVLLTPHNTASALLSAWMTQDWPRLYGFLARSDGQSARPDEKTALAAFAAARTLTGFTLSPGNVSSDGRRAVLSARMSLRNEGDDLSVDGYPLTLVREGSLWKISYPSLLALMNQN